jgi:hypothetical protein
MNIVPNGNNSDPCFAYTRIKSFSVVPLVLQRSGLDIGGKETETVTKRDSGRERNKGCSQTLLSQDLFTKVSCDSNICFTKISLKVFLRKIE